MAFQRLFGGIQSVQERLSMTFEVLETVAMKITVFWDSCSLVDIYRSFGETYCLLLRTILKMEAAHSSETSVNFYQNVQCHIPEHINFQNHRTYGIGRFITFTTPLNYIWVSSIQFVPRKMCFPNIQLRITLLLTFPWILRPEFNIAFSFRLHWSEDLRISERLEYDAM
jgi:hypothetical protein